MTIDKPTELDASLLIADGTRLANGYFLPAKSPKASRPKGAKGILGLLRDSVLEVLLSEDKNGMKLIQADIAALKPVERANLAAKLIPKAYDIALSVSDSPVPIVLDALDVKSSDPLETAAIAQIESNSGVRGVLCLD